MGRIPDHLLRLAQRVAEGRWVTIGAKADPKRPGKKKGGTPVELDGEGVIQKGPAALTGKRPSELSQSHLFTGQPHMSQRKMFAEPGDPVPPPRLDPEAKPQAQAPAKKEPKPKAKKPQNMGLLAIVRREGGISSGDYEHADFREFGLLGALKKSGHSLDDMAATLVRQGHISVPADVASPGDHLLQLLKKKTKSLLAFDQEEYDKDYEAYIRAREEAVANGHEERELEEVRGRGEGAGGTEGQDSVLDEIFGWDGSGGGEAGAEEPGDLAGDAAEPASGVDTSFDFGPAAAPKVEDKPKAEPKKAAADKPKGATLQPDGTLKTKDGTVWVRAKAGGEHSPVTDKHYKGGQWMPIHGMSKPKGEKPAEEPVGTQAVEPGEGDKERAEDKGGPRPPREPRQPATPEEIARKQKDQEHWDTVKQGPLGRIRGWMGDFPNKRGAMPSINAKSWQKLAEELGPEKVKQIADEMERRRLGRLAKAYDEMTPKEKGDETKEEFLDSWRQIWNKTNDLFGISQQHHKQFPDSYRAVKHLFDEMDNSRTPESLRKLNDYLAGVQNGQADEPAPPPAVEPKPAAKQPHEMTAAEYLRNGRPNYGDLVQTPDGKVGTLQGGGGIGSTRVKVNGVWHDRNDLKLVKRPDKDTRQNLSDEWKAKQKADLEKIEKEHGEVLHKKSMVDSAKKRLQAGTMTQDQYDKFVGSGPYKMTDAEMARAEKAQAEIDAIKDRPLEFDQSVHAQAVDNALAMGKDVPANVLAEYPDLAKKYAKGKAQGDGPVAPPAPGTNLFGTPEPTKPQPATTQGLFGEQVPVEDKKTQPKPTAADDAAKGLDWLDQKQDRKTDGTGEMFGGLFSPGQQASQVQQEPVAPPPVEPEANAKPKVTPPAPKAPYAQRRGSVNFSPVTGPTGHKLVGYNWEHDKVDTVDDRGENRTRKVSAWDRATQADETNRPIVHNFTVQAPDGTTKTVSLETAARLLGFDASDGEPKAKFQSAVSAAKTLAKLQMERAELVQRADRWKKDKADVDRQVEALPDDQIEEVPDTMGRPEYRVFRWKNQPEISIRRKMNQPDADREEAKRQVRWALADSEMEKRGHKEMNFRPNTAKIDGSIKRAQEKLDELTKQASQPVTAARASTLTDLALQKAGVAQNTDDAGLKQAGPVAPPPVEPSPTAAAVRTLSLPDRIKNLNALLNKTRSRANAKALRATIAQLEREAEVSTAPPKVETSKPAHEMTKAEFQKAYMDKANELMAKVKGRKMKDVMGVAGKAIAELGGDHFEQIKKAKAAGKAIPQEVLADYPYLKEPHEMTQQEWAAKWLASSPGRASRDIDLDLVKLLRKADVKRAIDAGKQVPASVLADYPDLKPGTEDYDPLSRREDPAKSDFWLHRKTELGKKKPSPINRMFGSNPTAEQQAIYAERLKDWNRKYRQAEKMRKELREKEDAAYKKQSATESARIRALLREALR